MLHLFQLETNFFSDYDACLNLGGFCNISFKTEKSRKAFDISVCNKALNRAANLMDLEYDVGGEMAMRGVVNKSLLSALNDLDYYSLKGAKSLANEWFEKHFWALVKEHKLNTEDLLTTLTEHISLQIAKTANELQIKTILVSGGGAHNAFLIKRIADQTKAKLTVPNKNIVDFKEAMIFALLAYLKIENKPNIWCSYTGASSDSIAGVIYKP